MTMMKQINSFLIVFIQPSRLYVDTQNTGIHYKFNLIYTSHKCSLFYFSYGLLEDNISTNDNVVDNTCTSVL